VHSLDAVRKLFEQGLGIPSSGQEEVQSQKVRVEFYQMGDVRIECLEATSEDSPIAKFLAKKGEGIHHIAFKVLDIHQAMKQAQEHGVELIDREPRLGAGGCKIAFLHPKSTHGVLIELVEETNSQLRIKN
jgi:methylmalonyl-CoA/ethylmalonyl-CoA epimerase